ncbi:MAG TPA: hypothetical protein VM011_11620 [Gammaproteobacteria bacterium]|nr:hypothetical protein [Gammaproteobacteria bacterium]
MKRRGDTVKWYTRREGVVRGPFPAAEVTRYILLGRICLDDELSRDRLSWSHARALTGLLPHEMLSLSSWEDYQRYIEARMQVDERRTDRRRDTCPRCKTAASERRAGTDRRREDNLRMIDSYMFGFQGLDTHGSAKSSRTRTLLLTLLLATLVFAWLVPVSR